MPQASQAAQVSKTSLYITYLLTYLLTYLGSAGIASIAAAGAREALPLLLSSALFGLVHAEFVNEPPPGTAPSEFNGVGETKAAWFWSTATYGLAYGSLYVVSGHQVLSAVHPRPSTLDPRPSTLDPRPST